jgi:hypothetical protein
MRNNEDRLSAPPQAEAPPATSPPPVTTPKKENVTPPVDPLQFVTPTEFVELPSKGKFYPEGHALHNQEVVEIKYMTAKDEDILTSRALLKKGLAIDRFIQNIIVDKSIKVEDMLVGDKNAIIIASRINGYGREYKTRVTCPACGESGQNVFDLGESEMGSLDLEDCSHEYAGNGLFIISLPKMKADVKVRLLTGADEKKLSQIQERARKQNLPERSLTTQFRMFIVAVNENDDPSLVNSLIENMPASDSRYLREEYKKLSPNVEMKQWYSCSICGNEAEMEVPFTTDFFWPK